MKMFAKTIRSASAFLLVAALFLGVCSSPIALAAEALDKEGPINYVSLGDSMTNGYGMEGYDHNSGVADYAENAYPNQFAEWLGATTHTQLAMSGIRTEDIHWLLEFDYNDEKAIDLVDRAVKSLNNWGAIADEWNEFFGCGDFWTVNEIVDHSRINATFAHIAGMTNYETYTGCDDHAKLVKFPKTVEDKGTDYTAYTMAEKIAVIAKYYQENVADADIISLSVGNGNIGVFGFGRILEAIGFDEGTTYRNYYYEDVLRECEPEMKERLMALIEELKPMLEEKLGALASDDKMQNVMLYIAVSLAMNYAGTLDAILQMNPDVEIILVPVMNTFGDNFQRVEGEVTIGDLLELVVDPINKFIAGLPTYMQLTNHEVYEDAKFYYAEPSKSIECIVETYKLNEEDGTPNLNDIVRSRFVESIVGGGSGMIWGMLGEMVVEITLAEIEVYEALDDAGKLAYAAGESFEIGEGEDAVVYVGSADKAKSIAIYLAFENAVILGKDTPVLLSSIASLGGGLSFDAVMGEFEEKAAASAGDYLYTVAGFMAAVAGMGTTEVDDLLEAAKTADVNPVYMLISDQLTANDLPLSTEDVENLYEAVIAAKAAATEALPEDASEDDIKTTQDAAEMQVYFDFVAKIFGQDSTVVENLYENELNADVVEAVNGLKSAVANVENANQLCTLLATPKALSGALQNPENGVSSLLALFARCVIGNGIGAHPSEEGHNTLATAVIEAYRDGKYAADKTDANINNKHFPVVKEIVNYLTASGYLNDDQILNIAFKAYDLLGGGELTGANRTKLVDCIYGTLLLNKELTDEDRIEIIGNVYAILDNHNYISTENAKYAKVVENIYNALTEAELLTDAQAWNIVNFVYVTLMDNNGNVDTKAMRTIAIYIYDVVLNGESSPAAYARGGAGEEMSIADKFQAIKIVYNKLMESDIVIAETYPQFETLSELADELIFNDDALLTPEQSMAIIDAAFNTLVVEEKGAEEAVEELTKVVTEEVFDNPDVDPMVKLEVIDKIGAVVGELVTPEGGSGSESEDPMANIAEYTQYIGVAKQIVANLKAEKGENGESLFDEHADAQFNALISSVIGILMKGEQVDLATLAETAFSMLFEQPNLTLKDKIRIVVVIYETLEEETDLVIFTDIDNFVEETEKLVEELKKIVLANEELVKELYANLEVMNAEVEALVAELGEKLVALDKLENDVLVTLKKDRAELVKELAGLEEKLEAVVNGTYGRAAVSDKDALIADTKAAIAETKAAIAELDATIDYVVNQIKTDKSGIEAIKADIAEIKANITATENALAEVVEALEQLKADLEVLANAAAVLYEVSVGQFVDEKEVIEAIVAIAETVPSMVENVKALYEQGVVAAETVEALVNVISENAEAIGTAVENLYASAEDWANVNVEKAEAIADTLKEIKAKLEAFVNENYPAAEEAVIETVNKLKAAIEAYVKEDVIPLVEKYKEVALLAAAAAYLYADEKGYIDYVKELVNGYIEDAEEIVEDLKADLKDAKIELEAKRAELEAKLPGWKEDLKQLKEDLLEEADAKKQAAIEKAIAELEDEIEAAEKVVAELEAFAAEVEAHLAEVEAAVEAVKAALNAVDGDIVELKEALNNLAVALKDLGCSVGALAETVAGEVEKLVGYGVMIGEDIIAVIETLDVYCDLAERFADVLKNELIEKKLEVLEYLAEVLKDACEYLVDAIYDAIVEYLPELDAALYDYFYNHPEEVINFVKTYGPYLLPIIEEYGDEALAFIGYILYMYGDDMAAYVIENHEEILAGFVAWADKYGERTVAMLQVYAEALGLCDAVREEIAELEALLEQLYAELEKATGEAKEAIEAKIAEVKAAIAELEAKLAAVIEALNKAAEDVNAKVEDLIADIKDAIADLEKALEDLEKAVEDLINETLKAIRDEIFESNRIVLEKILGIAEDILNKNIETLEELVAALEEAAIEAAKEIKAIIDELVYDATHGEYVIENDSFYVALGDSSAVSQSYVDALAAVLGVDYENLAQAGHTATDTLALIAEKAELLAKADLVTVGYTANIFTAEVVYTINDIMMGNEVVEYDWAALVTEDGVEYVEKALAEVHAKLVEQGMDVDFQGRNLADMLVACVEAYAYRYVEHVLTYPEIVNAVHNVAPEALVVIVGLHNTVENIVIDVEGTEVALGEYVQYAVDAANVVSLVNAILVEDTVFVATPDVETLKEEKGDALNYDMVGFVWEVLFTNGADFATSANGHAYIAEQILNALTVIDNRTGLLGDADGDGDVDSTDAMLVLQYDALLIDKDQLNLVVCDVDGDGDVDSTDAMYILQYDGLLIEVFPVEE